jgi:hypothetical protein
MPRGSFDAYPAISGHDTSHSNAHAKAPLWRRSEDRAMRREMGKTLALPHNSISAFISDRAWFPSALWREPIPPEGSHGRGLPPYTGGANLSASRDVCRNQFVSRLRRQAISR